MVDCYEFSAELWIWHARKEDGWTFLSVPPEESEEIRAYSASRPRAGFGSVRVSVTIGSSTWQTSVFPGEDGNYALPIKKSVRRVEGIEAGDVVTVMFPRSIAEPSSRHRGACSAGWTRMATWAAHIWMGVSSYTSTEKSAGAPGRKRVAVTQGLGPLEAVRVERL